MKTLSVLFVVLILAACGSSTGPGKAGDPSLLITNDLTSDYVYITWKDGNAIVGRDSVAPRTANQCVRFLAQPDSAYWQATASDNGRVSTQSYPYFNPASRPAWKVVVSVNPGNSPSILTTLVATAC
jgi:hypothetical protein